MFAVALSHMTFMLYVHTQPPLDRNWPHEFSTLLTTCWDKDPNLRPDFATIVTALQVCSIHYHMLTLSSVRCCIHMCSKYSAAYIDVHCIACLRMHSHTVQLYQ
jgi:hypothetical protein